MQLTITTALSMLFLCCLWDVEARKVISTLTVDNGGIWGKWGEEQFCPKGYAKGFSLKMELYKGTFGYDTSLNAIRLHCSDGSLITSSEGQQGTWSNEKSCKSGFLSSFSLRLTLPEGLIDDAEAENVKFKCSDGTELEGNGQKWGEYGSWSRSCKKGSICGIQTRVDSLGWLHEQGYSELIDVKFFCCI